MFVSTSTLKSRLALSFSTMNGKSSPSALTNGVGFAVPVVTLVTVRFAFVEPIKLLVYPLATTLTLNGTSPLPTKIGLSAPLGKTVTSKSTLILPNVGIQLAVIVVLSNASYGNVSSQPVNKYLSLVG